MMPSRGARIARGKLPRLHQTQCRNLSSTWRQHPRTASIHTTTSRTVTPWTRSIPTAIPSIVAIRYASTAPAGSTAQVAAAATTSTPATETASLSSIDSITLDTLEQAGKLDPSSLSEGIGYLQEIGGYNGIGPTAIIQTVLEHIHIWGGIPWGASIFLTAAALRLLLLPLFLRGSDAMARAQALGPVMKPFMLRFRQAQQEGNGTEVKRVWSQMAAIRRRAGIQYHRQFTPAIFQVVLGFCGFRLMKKLADLPVPGFKDGGFLWMPDLTLTDGYLITPLVMAAVLHLSMRLGGDMGSSTMPPGMSKFMLYGMPVISFIVIAFQPGALALWFAGTGAVGLAQARCLQNEKFRKFFGLAPLWKSKAGDSVTPLELVTGRSPSQAQNAAKSAESPREGKNAAFMRPTYQSPRNISRADNNRAIDAKLVDTSQSSGEMVQPGSPAPAKSYFSGIRNKLDEIRAKALAKTQMTPEQIKAAERKNFQKRAAAYERRATQGKRK